MYTLVMMYNSLSFKGGVEAMCVCGGVSEPKRVHVWRVGAMCSHRPHS